MEFLAPSGVDAGIGVGRLENLAVLGSDRAVPLDQHLRGAVGLGVVPVQPLHEHHPLVVDRRRAVVDDVLDAAVVVAAEAARERQVVAVAQMPRDVRCGAAGHAVRGRRVDDGHARFGLEAVGRVDELVDLRHRPVRVAEGALVHEREVRVVERVLHHPHRAGLPLLIELEDAAVAGAAVLGKRGDRQQRVGQRDPHVAVLLAALEGRHLGVRGDGLVGPELRDAHALAARVVGPAVVAADDAARVIDTAFAELRGAVAAAVAQRRRRAVGSLPQHQVFAEQRERLRSVIQRADRHQRIPEAAQDGLLGHEHAASLQVGATVWARFATASGAMTHGAIVVDARRCRLLLGLDRSKRHAIRNAPARGA